MKQCITLLLAAAIISSCSKQDLQEENLPQQNFLPTIAFRAGQEGSFVSGWEQYSDWTKTEQGNISVFTLNRKTPEVNASVVNGGLVLTYAKVATSDPLYISFTSPKMVPFYYLPESERPQPQMFYFTDAATDGNIALMYRVPFTKQSLPAMAGGASLQAMQFQYVVLTKAFLESRGLTAGMVRNNYTYDQVMALVNP